MKITINGEENFFPQPVSVAKLLHLLELDSMKVAIERNLEIVSRSRYEQTALMDGDAVEIVHFIGGG